MILEAAKELYQKFKPHKSPELHSCKYCGAGVSRLYLIAGGIIHYGSSTTVRMEIGCRDCHRSHKVKGNSVREHWLALQLANNSRRVRA
jgi:hypothetical protein